MSMKIPDLQMVVARAGEISRLQQLNIQEHVIKKQETAAQMTQQTAKKEQTVFEAPPGDPALMVDRNRQDNQQGKKKKQDQEPGEREEQDDALVIEKISGLKVDIMV